MSGGFSVKLPSGSSVHLETGEAPTVNIKFTQGMAGPRGTWAVDRSFQLRQLPLSIHNGRIEIDFSEANTYYILMTENITEVVYSALPPPEVSVRVQLYLEQDATGGRYITGWPPGSQTPGGIIPILSQDPGALDSIVIDTFDGGATSQINIVGQKYSPL